MDEFTNTDHGKELSDEIHSIFRELKESLKSENIDHRKAMKDFFERIMEDLVKCYDPYRELHKHVEYIRNGLGSWFTCLLYHAEWNRQSILLNRLSENMWS